MTECTYEVQYQLPTSLEANIWSCKTKWKNAPLKNNPDATEILSLEQLITVKFKFTQRHKLYTGALTLIKQLLRIEAVVEEEGDETEEENE